MRVLILSCDPKEDEDLIKLGTTLIEKGHMLFVVSPTKPEALMHWPKIESPHEMDIPGHGWLPFAVNDLDATSYLLKRNIHAIVTRQIGHQLEQTFVHCSNIRPALVLLNPGEAAIPAFRERDSRIFNWPRRVSKKQCVETVRQIVDLVASRP
ncbi:hypothetical protein KBC59_01885 [Patescibacteria group bacterium]|jgi:hypothetical protein|nr:hypothetical protein [Patescibacteria group bacterium]